MLTIRLQRTGKKNQADFRIVLAEKEAPVQKKFIEVLGNYNPRKKVFSVKKERVEYWFSQNIECSPTAHNLFVSNGLLSKAKVKAFSVPKKAQEEPAAPKEEKPAETATEAPKAEEKTEAPQTETEQKAV